MAEDLSLHGFKGAAIDQRGHGESERPPATEFSSERIRQDLHEFLEMLEIVDLGWKQPVLVGQSWGCAVVLDFIAQYPHLVSGAVLVDGGFGVMKERFPTWELCAEVLAPPRFSSLSLEELATRIRQSHADWPESGILATLANLESDEDGHARARLSFDSHMAILHNLWQFDPPSIAPTISTPVEFVVALNDDMGGRDSKIAAVTEMQRQLGGPSTATFIEGDHDLHAQFPQLLSANLRTQIYEGIFA
jgi:pimeloyl-ACP methyl ester carboxylesterase